MLHKKLTVVHKHFVFYKDVLLLTFILKFWRFEEREVVNMGRKSPGVGMESHDRRTIFTLLY